MHNILNAITFIILNSCSICNTYKQLHSSIHHKISLANVFIQYIQKIHQFSSLKLATTITEMHKSHILERHVTNIMAKIHKRPSACSLDCYCYRILWKTNSSIAKPNQLLYEQNVSSVFSTKAITRTSSISQWTCYFLPFVPTKELICFSNL